MKNLTTGAARTLEALLQDGLIPEITAELRAVAAQFSVAVSPALLAAMDVQNPRDPIMAQFAPSPLELQIKPGEMADPIGDQAHTPIKGIVHRYTDRVLLKLTAVCPVHCRYCFRRCLKERQNGELKPVDLSKALAYIRERRDLWEVILSGGEPLVLPDRRLAFVMRELNKIDPIKVIRIHTRMPLAHPERITAKLIDSLRTQKALYVLLHCNHANELTAKARQACARFVDAGIPMLSQSVLLRGVNDNPEALRDLMKAFVENRIKPHYLHHPDLAQGTSHFRLPLAEGQALVKTLRGRLSGLCQPSYILDIPGGHGKVPVGPVYATPAHKGFAVEDINGRKRSYRDA